MKRETEEQPLELSVEEVSDNVRRVVATALDIDEDDVKLESSLFELGAESLDLLDIAFMLEKDYRIQYPGTGLLDRASQYFAKDTLSSNGVVTDLGLQLLRMGMPELDPAALKPGLKEVDVAKMVQVGSFVRITLRLLAAKAEYPRVCTKCGGELVESEVTPEFECAGCGDIVPVPSGDDILLADLIRMYEGVTQDPGRQEEQ